MNYWTRMLRESLRLYFYRWRVLTGRSKKKFQTLVGAVSLKSGSYAVLH